MADNARAEAKERTSQNAELQVAIKLKQLWKRVQLGARSIGKPLRSGNPTDAEFETMAKELIDQRQFSLDGKTIKISELDKFLEDEKNRAAMNGITSFNQLVPTRRQIGLISDAVAEGVDENTGTIGMFKGATFGAVLQGLFAWIFSFFSGGMEGLTNSIASVTAGNMQQSVTQNLTSLRDRLRGTGDDISGFMGDTVITETGEAVRNTVLAQTESPGATEAAPTPTLATTSIGEFDIRDYAKKALKEKLNAEILQGFSENDTLKPVFAATSWTGSIMEKLRLSNTQEVKKALKDVADKVSTRLSDIITDPNYVYNGKKFSEMSKEDRAVVLAAEAKATVQHIAAQPGNKEALKILENVVAEDLSKKIYERIKNDVNYNKIPWADLGHGAGPNNPVLSPLPPDDPTAYLVAAQKMAFNQLQSTLDANKPLADNIAKIGGRKPDDNHLDAIAAAVAPTLVEWNKKTSMTSASYGELSKEFRAALVNKSAKINMRGLHLSNDALASLADIMAVQYVESKKTAANPLAQPEAFKAQVKKNEAKLIEPMVEKKVADGLADVLKDQKISAFFTAINGGFIDQNKVAKVAAKIVENHISDNKFLALPDDAKRAELDKALMSALTDANQGNLSKAAATRLVKGTSWPKHEGIVSKVMTELKTNPMLGFTQLAQANPATAPLEQALRTANTNPTTTTPTNPVAFGNLPNPVPGAPKPAAIPRSVAPN